ncbi:hypothetical protein BaRGS_00008563 [Batillaria attramentaria]|uniref:Uncharacterized protein n=1 Tax=Batillaria attramentaria TaxID=370345 RepID=A0ABD0LLY6_9CAEN
MSYQMLRSLFHSPFLVASKRLQNVTVGRLVHYVQGQSPEPRIREYFYYIDHQGQLFLDDAKMKNFTSCFKEKDFLVFFFNRLKFNDTERYREDFPYLSLCGRERNYIRCDDRPIVFTHIIESTESSQVDRLSYNGAAERLTVTFEPDKVCMFPDSGRVYHPAPERTGGVGLVRSALAIELSKKFEFENGESDPPTHFTWKDVRYTLTNDLFELMDQSHA